MSEKRYTELRQDGRVLVGTAIKYGDVATLPWGKEKFEPGAFGPVVHADVILNSQHDRQTPLARTGGGGLTLSDSPSALIIRADLPDTQAANDVLELVRKKVLRGLSIEFKATQERNENDLRIIERADLSGCAVVDSGAYPGSSVDARARKKRKRSGRTVRAEIPVGKPLSCECVPQGSTHIEFSSEAVDNIFNEKLFEKGSKQIVAAYLENYSSPLASTSRGTLRGAIKGTGLKGRRPVVEIDIPDSQAGRDLIAAWESSGIIVRPFLADIEGELVNGVQKVKNARLRALIVSATDAREGWPEPEIIATSGAVMNTPKARHRFPLWL